MASFKSVGSMTKNLSRGLATSTLNRSPLQVMVSQSNDLVANMALEEWIKRSSTHRRHSNLLLLSSNALKQGKSIHAHFYPEESGSRKGMDQLIEQANLVFSSLPKDTAMTELPVVRVAEEDNNNLLISLPVYDMEEKAVNTTLQCIVDSFIQCNCVGSNDSPSAAEYELSRLSLVRPDGGWFPGIQDIQKDLEQSLREVEAIKSDKTSDKKILD